MFFVGKADLVKNNNIIEWKTDFKFFMIYVIVSSDHMRVGNLFQSLGPAMEKVLS